MIGRRRVCRFVLATLLPGLAGCAAPAPRRTTASGHGGTPRTAPSRATQPESGKRPLPTYEPDELSDAQKVKLFQDFDASRAASQ